MIDCGMFQGSERLERQNRIPKEMDASRLDAVVLTHGHLDHCGRLPLLVRAGYSGPIWATPGTIDIARLILNDAAKIQLDDCARLNRKRAHERLPQLKPLFNSEHVLKTIKLFRPVDYNSLKHIAPGVTMQLVDAGHILGSSSALICVDQNGAQLRFVFSGDIGQYHVPIMKNPARIEGADVVFMESDLRRSRSP